MRWAGTRRWSSRAFRSRWCTTACSTPSISRRINTLILPNIAALSDAQCDQLRAFVRGGGNIIATHETSLYDEQGAPRKNFALADLFGVDFAGKTDGPMQNSYIRLEHDAHPRHPLFAGLEDAPRIINGVSRLEVTPRAPFAETPLTLIPSYPDLPMEKVYPRVPKTDISCLYLRAGRRPRRLLSHSIIDRTFWEVLSADHLKLLRNTLEWAHNEPPVVEVNGPGLLDVTVVAQLRLHHRPPRQPHQSHGDERPLPRLLSGRRTDRAAAPPGKHSRHASAASGQRQAGPHRTVGGRTRTYRAIGPRP